MQKRYYKKYDITPTHNLMYENYERRMLLANLVNTGNSKSVANQYVKEHPEKFGFIVVGSKVGTYCCFTGHHDGTIFRIENGKSYRSNRYEMYKANGTTYDPYDHEYEKKLERKGEQKELAKDKFLEIIQSRTIPWDDRTYGILNHIFSKKPIKDICEHYAISRTRVDQIFKREAIRLLSGYYKESAKDK